MRFYLDGYTPGDPDILAAAPGAETRPADFPDTVDVLIVGTGPAGMVLAASSRRSRHHYAHRRTPRRPVAGRPGGRRGVSHGRDVGGLGLREKLVREGYWVNETVFWRPSPDDQSTIMRTVRVQDTEDGLSEFPHLIVNQARC